MQSSFGRCAVLLNFINIRATKTNNRCWTVVEKEKNVKNHADKLTIIVNGAIIKEYRNGKLYKKRSTNNNGQGKKGLWDTLLDNRIWPNSEWDYQSEESRERLHCFERETYFEWPDGSNWRVAQGNHQRDCPAGHL